MITLDKDKCTQCGLCVKICHESCMALVDHSVTIDYELCSTCTQCIAVCPQQALSWDGASPDAYDKTLLPSPQQLEELFKERRTIRFFKEEKIDRALLEEIVGSGIYAPTNNFALKAIVVDDREIIEDLEQMILRSVTRIYNLVFRPKIVFNLIRMITPSLDPKDKVKIEEAMERGRNLATYPAAAVFIVGDRRVALSEASAQYALYNMILYAQAKGIGSCLRGAGQIFLDRNKAARKRLRLQKHEHILGTLLLGYPAVRFSNKVQGKPLPIQWVNGSDGVAVVQRSKEEFDR
jgi:nitroreductase/NAD-dependent dihydropyrimidine dehydrogenase PreA subunit